VGIRVSRRATVAATAVTTVTLVAAVTSLAVGTLDIPLDRVWASLTGHGTRIEQLVVDRRLGRALAAILVGFALGLSGALTQSVTRNPIASPDILGVTAGAGLFAVIVVTRPEVSGRITGEAAVGLLAPAALAGGLATTAVILALGWRGGFDGLRLILVGLGVNALAMAGTSWLLTRTDLDQAAVATRWLTGSLEGARLGDVGILLPVVLGCTAACLMLNRSLTALRLGRDVAASIGTPPGRTEAWCLGVAVVAVSVATAVAGPIGFVAFVAPQAAIRLFGTAGAPPLAGGVVGAALVLFADLTAQRLPVPLPVGVVTAVIGAPALLFLLTRYVRRTSV
jgi:iron complex transport system permease protein